MKQLEMPKQLKLIQSESELRDIVGTPHEHVIKKTISIIDKQIEHFISQSPLFMLSTSDSSGLCDVSPRGDEAGFVKVLDEKHLVFGDRPGNRRADSLHNLLSNPQVGMLFLVPGVDYVVRINGRASLAINEELLHALEQGRQKPQLAVVVEVEEAFLHCTRALLKSQLWKPETWVESNQVPDIIEMFHSHLSINGIQLKK